MTKPCGQEATLTFRLCDVMVTLVAPSRDVRVASHPCQNERKTTVINGHPRALRTASDLGACKLTCCLKPTS